MQDYPEGIDFLRPLVRWFGKMTPKETKAAVRLGIEDGTFPIFRTMVARFLVREGEKLGEALDWAEELERRGEGAEATRLRHLVHAMMPARG